MRPKSEGTSEPSRPTTFPFDCLARSVSCAVAVVGGRGIPPTLQCGIRTGWVDVAQPSVVCVWRFPVCFSPALRAARTSRLDCEAPVSTTNPYSRPASLTGTTTIAPPSPRETIALTGRPRLEACCAGAASRSWVLVAVLFVFVFEPGCRPIRTRGPPRGRWPGREQKAPHQARGSAPSARAETFTRT